MALSDVDKSQNLTPDIYGISDYVNELKKKFTPDVNEDTLMLGIFGYLGENFSDMLQNTIVMTSEFANEAIPIKAKFEKNVIAHALGLEITDITAVPATLDVILTFIEDDIIDFLHAYDADGNELGWGEDGFIFDKDTEIYIGDYCFQVDYDIQIRKVELPNAGNSPKKFSYTARYLIDIDNPVSNITNPYLSAPIKMKANGRNILLVKTVLRQVTHSTIFKKVFSDNSLASKTVTFSIDPTQGQLASFTIDVTEGNNTIHLIPVYEGLNVQIRKYPYFYYTYLDANTIRIKFDRYSYQPRITSDVKINLTMTNGEAGNFTFDPEVYPGYSFESEKYGYSNIVCEIRPITGISSGGVDKKTIADLKKIIPREALSRGSITNMADLQNYFNAINTDMSVMYFYKKRDNALERLYYSFILMRDEYNVIIPTNTIPLKVRRDQLQEEENSGKLLFKRGQKIKLDMEDGYGKLVSDDDDPDYGDNFQYVIPYSFIINRDPLYGMYLLSTINTDKFLEFVEINYPCLYQYIATSIHIYRGYIDEPNKYTLTLDIEQNVAEDEEYMMVTYNEDGSINMDDLRIKCIAVFYNAEGEAYRWADGLLTNFDKATNIFSFKFEFTTEDYIDANNRIRIDTGLYDLNTTNESYGHLPAKTKCRIYIASIQGDYGLLDLDKIVPGLKEKGFTVSNIYEVMDGIDFFYDFSDIINSTVIAKKSEDASYEYYKIDDVPVVKADYFETEEKVDFFCRELVRRKTYIDYAVQRLEDAFGMNFQFFNTYGPSKLFTLDEDTNYVNHVNMSLTFRLRLKPNYDTNVINDIINDIKTYIEDIDEVKSIHMPNLITQITTTYREYLVYFEFVDMNGYGPSVQHLYSMPMPDEVIVPEFINIQALPDGTPDIKLIEE